MGAGGGFELAKKPDKISLYQVIEAVQGDISLNRCVSDPKSCPKRSKCMINRKLVVLEKHIEEYLKNITLDELLKN
jgi:Rrf2 family protein